MTSHRATVLVALTLLEGCSLIVSGDRGDLGTGAGDASSRPLDGGANSSTTESVAEDGKGPTSPERADGAAGMALDAGNDMQANDAGDDATVMQDRKDASTHDASLPPPPACPEVASMKMARIETPAGGYCIDVHEVSQRQYWAFLDATPDPRPLYRSQGCADVRDVSVPWRPGKEDHPVAGVSYCGADAYCSFVGKSLCGDISGSPLEMSLLNNALHDMWWRACSGGEHRAYPYGETYAPTYCNGESGLDTTTAGSLPQCVTLEQAVFDLSGNVWEWTNVCNQDLNTGDYCLARGGSFHSTPDELSCSFTMLWAPRTQVQPDMGFRCCSR